MPSIVEICNLGLNHIGQKTIASLDETSENARRCKLVFPNARDAVLRDHHWNFATAYKQLAELNDELIGWNYLYVQPSECLKIRKVFNETSISSPIPQDFKILLSPTSRIKSIATNVESAWAEYTYRVTDPALYDPMFVDTLAYRIGAMLAQPLAGNIQMGQALMQASMTIIANATLQNAREGSVQKPSYSSLIEAR